MKRCPSCNRTYNDESLNFCLEDGTPLVGAPDPNATLRYPPPRETGEPPTEIYRQPQPLLNQVPEMAQRRPAPVAPYPPYQPQPQKKSKAIWWILGTLVVLGVMGVGLIVIILALASLGANQNSNTNNNSNVFVREGNANKTEENTNANATPSLPPSITDDFSTVKWKTGTYQYGDIWYLDDEYHMRSKEKTYLVMYAPSGDYNTEDAKIRVTTRSVDGTSPASGYGLVVHGAKSKDDQLEDYGLLIYTGDEPQYQIVAHKEGQQKSLVPWTKSSVIRPGTSPNQLEIRTQNDGLSFYVNGRYLTRIPDSENFKRGVAGLYTSDTVEVAFDDLEIER